MKHTTIQHYIDLDNQLLIKSVLTIGSKEVKRTLRIHNGAIHNLYALDKAAVSI